MWSYFSRKSLIFEKFSKNSRQKNSDRTTQQPSFVFRDERKGSTVNSFLRFLSNIDKSLIKVTENVNKNSNYSQNFKPR